MSATLYPSPAMVHPMHRDAPKAKTDAQTQIIDGLVHQGAPRASPPRVGGGCAAREMGEGHDGNQNRRPGVASEGETQMQQEEGGHPIFPAQKAVMSLFLPPLPLSPLGPQWGAPISSSTVPL
jgi:hypothetical protein